MNDTDTTEAARAAFMARLEADDFLPGESAVAAWNCQAEHSLPLSRDGRAALPEPPADEFGSFIDGYWDLVPEARWKRWHELSHRHPAGVIAARLKHLHRGLDVPRAIPHPAERVNALAVLFRELFLLLPRTRAACRRQWLRNAGDRKGWIEPVQALREVEPEVVALDPELTEWIEGFPRLKASIAARIPPGEVAAARLQRRYRAVAFGLVIAIVPILFLVGYLQNRASADRSPSRAADRVEAVDNTAVLRLTTKYPDRALVAYFDYRPGSGTPEPEGYTNFLTDGGAEVLETMRSNPQMLVYLRSRAHNAAFADILMTRMTMPVRSTTRR